MNLLDKENSETNKSSRLMIELDCLLDTRISLLMQMNNIAGKQALLSYYHDRTSDNFDGVSFKDFQEAYRNRNKSVLKNTMITPMGKLCKDFAVATLDNVNNSPFHYKPVIMVNIFPYVLSNEECSILINSVRAITSDLADIEIVSLSYEKLTPLYLKLNLSTLILYKYDDWLEIHAKSGKWNEVTAPDVTVIAPMISMIEQNRNTPLKMEAFESMQDISRPFVDLKYLPISMFSMVVTPADIANIKR